MLAVKVDFESRLATIGTDRDRPVPIEKILQSLAAIGYRGKLAE